MRLIKKFFLVLLLVVLSFGIFYAWQAVPIITGYGAKDLCSCTFLGERSEADVINNELNTGPLKLGTYRVSYDDSSATATVFGLARRKAIYRQGLGCTLLVEMPEEELRSQKFILAKPPIVNQDTIPWPSGNKTDESKTPEVNYALLNETIEEAFSEPGPKKSRRTRSIIVVYDGKIIAERYAKGFDKDSKQIAWSMTKSMINAMVGVMVRKGLLDVNAKAPVDEWNNDDRAQITLHHLLQGSSGLDWEENYGKPSGATNMLFKKKDMSSYAATSPLKYEPGKLFYYSSGTTNIISGIIRNTLGDHQYHRFPYEQLFYKIGMYNTILEPDASGTFVGSSYSFGTARDFARFGLLYLNDGIWNGERILPEVWVKYTATPAPGAPLGQYGAQFWLNAGAPSNPSKRTYPDVPTDLISADGFEGQNIFIIPSKKLVVVKLSLSQNGEYMDDNKFLSNIINSLPNDK